MTTWLHEQRLKATHEVVVKTGATSILDLGCGDGDLILRLLDAPQIERILAVDLNSAALERLRHRLTARGADWSGRVDLLCRSMTEPTPAFANFDCTLLVETIEHLPPDKLSSLERAVFRDIRSQLVVITTPNAEFNSLLGVPHNRFRHPDHRFEWPRERFRQWSRGVAQRGGYTVTCHDIAGWHSGLGGASQMAVFRQVTAPNPAAA